jgi:hypothetical protein
VRIGGYIETKAYMKAHVTRGVFEYEISLGELKGAGLGSSLFARVKALALETQPSCCEEFLDKWTPTANMRDNYDAFINSLRKSIPEAPQDISKAWLSGLSPTAKALVLEAANHTFTGKMYQRHFAARATAISGDATEFRVTFKRSRKRPGED